MPWWVRRGAGLLRLVRPRLIERPLWRARFRRGLPKADPTDLKALFPPKQRENWLTVLENHRTRTFGFADAERAAVLTALRSRPDAMGRVLTRADEVSAGIIDVLGSGPVTIGLEPDWQLDFRSGHRFPEGWFWLIDHRDPRRASDVKVPWELARFHAGLWLGQAWQLTGEAKYAEAFARLAKSFLKTNPPGWGIHWLCPMELGIRAVNWIYALELLDDAPVVDAALRADLYASLFWHGRVIRGNLEVGRHVGNHYVADLMGLLVLGALFGRLEEGARWKAFACRELEAQVRCQVHPDGVNYEKSISYHRLVAELLLVSLAVGERSGCAFSPGYRSRLSAMLDFTLAYTRPDGSAPVLGDADDGRILPFVPTAFPTDHRPLLALGGTLLGQPDKVTAAGDQVGDALWLAGASRVEAAGAKGERPRPSSRAFPEGGFYVLRSTESHAILDGGELGFEGTLGHGHFDSLSLDLWAAGAPLLSDRGCYCYTSDYDAYREQLSARAHNTITVDDREPAVLKGFWRITPDATRPRVSRWVTSDSLDGIEEWIGEHWGYGGPADPIVHRRSVRFHRSGQTWEIADQLEGRGSHRVTVRWHCAPGVRATGRDGSWVLEHAHARFQLDSSVPLELVEGWAAPSYGVRVPVGVLVGTVTGGLPLRCETHLVRLRAEGGAARTSAAG